MVVKFQFVVFFRLKMEVVWPSEALVPCHVATRFYNWD